MKKTKTYLFRFTTETLVPWTLKVRTIDLPQLTIFDYTKLKDFILFHEFELGHVIN